MKRTHLCRLLTLFLSWTTLRAAPADPAPAPLPPVVARYEQMLAASPAKGTAFDKVYQSFFEGPGLDALAARWQARAAAGGPGAETFPLLVGLLAERRAHPDDARAAYHQYNVAHPDDPRGWTALGELETSEGHFVPAADALARALAPGAKPPVPVSTRPTLYRELARAQARSFLVAASLGTWRKLAAEFPDDPGVLQEVGEAFQEDQAYDEARATFEKVRELARQNNDAFGRINATLRTGQVEEARGHAAEAVKIYEGVVAEAKPGSWLEREARARIEQLYRGQEDLPGLADYYRKWLEDHPKDTEVATRRAAVLIELNRRAEAIELLQQAVVWAPERQELQVELARRLGETDRPAEMAAVMEKLTTVAPEEKSYWQLLGDARWQLLANLPATAPAPDRDTLKAQALAAWGHLSPADGKDPAATDQLADLLASHRLTDEALAQYARAAALAPDLPDARERWAGFLAQLDRKDEARRVVAGIVNASPKNATAANYSRLAAALDRLDDPAGALAATAQGLTLEPRNFDLLSQRWQLLASGKHWADAAALYPALLAAAPNAYFAEQVQVRQVAALQAANQLADTRAALTARLPTLDENALALLVRIDLQSANAETEADAPDPTRQALAEARARFPHAAAFARLEGEFAKRARDVDGQVAALRRLIDLQPAQKTDALAEIARVWRDAGKLDEATAAARELVAASPANAAAPTLLADLLLQAGQPDEGVARLRDAVRLSDKPNEVRLRLARVLGDLGRDAEARRTLDEAFEAAEDAHERLALTKGLAEAYQRENRLDELLSRFQTLQQGEAEGWRYALYLAAIYQESKDYGAARRELAKALAARPHDGALLRQLVRVAEDEQNAAEIARYQALLAEAEPSDQNQFALVTALLENNQAEAGFNALRAHLPAVLKIPGAWDELLPLLARNDLTAKTGDLLTAELGGEHADIKARFTLALFQAVAGNAEQARAAFWSVFDTKTGPAPLTASTPPKPVPKGNGTPSLSEAIYGGDSIPEQRYLAGEQTRRTAQALLYAGGFANLGRGRNNALVMPAPATGLPNTPGVIDTTRDAALLYLAALAVKDHTTAAEFIAELDRHLDARASSHADRLVAYSLLEDVDSQLREIVTQVRDPEPGLDNLALSRTALIAFNNGPDNRRYSETAPLTVAQAAALAPLFDPLLARLVQADPSLNTAEADAVRYTFLIGVGRKDQAEAVRRAFLAGVDAASPLDKLAAALELLMTGSFPASERAQLQLVVPAFTAAAARAVGTPSGANEAYYYPGTLFDDSCAAGKLPPEEFADVLAGLLRLWYPATPPAPTGPPLVIGSRRITLGSEDIALPPTRFFSLDVYESIQSVAQALQQGDAPRTAAVLARLDQQARDLPPARRVYPQIVAVYLSDSDPSQALTRAQALLAAAPDDQDLRLLTGALLGRADRHAEAVALLDTVDAARTGETPLMVQARILVEAKAAKDTESAKRAALRLVAMRVPPELREGLGTELRELGLTEQADALAKPAAGSAANASQPRSIFDSTTAARLEKLVTDKNEDAALALARNVFAALPPPPPGPNGSRANYDYVLRAALTAVKSFKQTEAFIAEAEKQLAKDPDSLSLNYELALLYQESGELDPVETPGDRSRTPVWVKLSRSDNGEITGYSSADGQAWHPIGHAAVPLGNAPLAILSAATRNPPDATLVADHVALAPPPAAPPADLPAAPPFPTPWTETLLPDDDASPADAAPLPPDAWSDGTFTLHARGADPKAVFDTGHLVQQPLGHATELTARIVSFEGSHRQTRAGIMFRAGPDAGAPYAAVLVAPVGAIVFQHRDHVEQATAYWRKLAGLRPKETRYQRLLAHRLAARGLRDEAAAVYDRLLDLSPDEGFSAFNELQFIYRGGQRLAGLAARLLAWKPNAGNSAYRGRVNNPGFSFFQVARECAAIKRPDLVVALCRRGLELDAALGGHSQDLHKLLLSTLLAQNRRDEARDALVADFLPPADAVKTTAAGSLMQLGFRDPTVARSNANRSWMANLSWSSDSVELPGLQPLEDARVGGLLPDLQAALQARQQADPAAFVQGDLDWLLTIVRLRTHDPTLPSVLPALLNGKPAAGDSSGGGNDHASPAVAVRLEIARLLLRWPGHESLALEAFASARKAAAEIKPSNASLFGNLSAVIGFEQARAELLLDDPRSAAVTLRALSAGLTAPNASSGGESEELHACLDLLLRAGPGADPAYLDVFNQAIKTPETRQSLPLAYDLEKNVRLGDNPRFQALAWLLDDGGGSAGQPGATLVYELRPEPPDDKSGLGRNPTSRTRSFAASEGARTLTFAYGPDPDHCAPIGQLKTDRTFGTWTGPIPPGAGVLKVTVDAPRARDAAALAAEPPASPGSGYCLRIVRAPNLLTNPRFDGLSNRDPDADPFSLPGWKDLPAGLWMQGTGDTPLPGQTCVRNNLRTPQSSTITGARIPLEPGHAYFQSGWVRDGGDNNNNNNNNNNAVRIGRRYLDADGKVLKTSECPEFSSLGWRWHSQRLLPREKTGGKDDDAIPPQTAFIEPFLRVQGGSEWTGLFLGKMD